MTDLIRNERHLSDAILKNIYLDDNLIKWRKYLILWDAIIRRLPHKYVSLECFENNAPMKILIVEDDLVIGENLKENLIEIGYEVVGVASNSTDAEQLLRSKNPDLCLMDINLKDSPKNGIEIVKDAIEIYDIPFIYLTSFDDQEYREKAKETDPAAYLLKPATKAQLDVAIDFAISNYLKSKATRIISEKPHCAKYESEDMIFIKSGGKYVKTLQSEIVYIEAAGAYTYIYTLDKKIAVSVNIKKLLSQMSSSNIVRTHRSYAVNKTYIQSFDEINLYLDRAKEMHTVPISRSHKESILRLLPKVKV